MTVSGWGPALAVILVGTAALVAGAAGAQAETGDGRPAAGGVAAATADGVEPERVVIEVALRPDGSAEWTVQHRVRLDEPADVQGFERARERIRENRSAFREPFARRVRAMATEAEDATGRTMVVENVSVDAFRTQLTGEYGVVEYSFRWYGFAATDDRLRAGGALRGLFLDPNTTLLVTWPGDAELAEVTPEPDRRRERAVVWQGPVEFSRNEPRVVLESGSVSFGPDLTPPGGSNDLLVTLLAVSAFVGLVIAGVVAWRYRAGSGKPAVAGAGGTTAASEPGETSATHGESDAPAAGADTGDPGGESAEPPAELLSNEEQVLALLEERGGRMKQQEVVGELGWSETKTSEVVAELREAEEIEVYRLGRENVLALPGTGLGTDSGGEQE